LPPAHFFNDQESTMPGDSGQHEMIHQIARQQEGMALELKSISKALTELAEQKKDIEHLLEHQRDQRSWLKNHEERIQEIEKIQAACGVTQLKDDVKKVKSKPGEVALTLIYTVVVVVVTTAITLQMKGPVGP
jgi:hypothetical protein